MRRTWKRVGIAIAWVSFLSACGTSPRAASGTGGDAAGQPSGTGGEGGGSASGDASGGSAGETAGGSAGNAGGDAGTGVECSRDEHCGNTEAHCDLERNECVECLADDHCSSGTYCSAERRCVKGCTVGAECATGLVCCEPHCVDQTRDIANCGACGVACSRADFCAPTGCAPAVIANVCALGAATALLDGAPADEQAAAEVLGALEAHCAPAPSTRALDQLEAGVIDPANGRIIASGGELLVLTGGPYFNKTAGFLEKQRDVPVYNGGSYPTIQFIRSADDTVISASTFPESTPAHDMILIQVGRERTTGTLALVLYGFHPNGTLAAAWHFANVMALDLQSYPDAYYVYDWTDANGDQVPNAGDTWRLLGSGS